MISIKINPSCTWGGSEETDKYLTHLGIRQTIHPISSSEKHMEIAQHVSDYGYSTAKSFIDPQRLAPIKKEFDEIRDQGELQYQDVYTEQCAHPLVNLPSVCDIVFDEEVMRLANGQTTLFHCDKDSPRFIKFFFYLDDVELDNGPFTYVESSHLKKFSNWRSKYRRSAEEIASFYGEEKIKYLTGNVGDLIMANTNGFHRGKKVTEGERLLLTAYYSVHPTQWQTNYGGQIKKQDYDNLPAFKRPMADYLNKV